MPGRFNSRPQSVADNLLIQTQINPLFEDAVKRRSVHGFGPLSGLLGCNCRFELGEPGPQNNNPFTHTTMQIYLTQNGQTLGPYTGEQLRLMVQGGEISANDLAWHEGVTDWQPFNTILDLTPAQAAVSMEERTEERRTDREALEEERTRLDQIR